MHRVRSCEDVSQEAANDAPEIGVALTAFGTLFMVLGVLLFFDGGLLAVGNVRSNVS